MLRIAGGPALRGEVRTQGSKNATLPVLAASLLCEGELLVEGAPRIGDVETMRAVLAGLGVASEWTGDGLLLRPGCGPCEPPAEAVGAMRASFLVLGALLGRRGQAVVALPGGCAIGPRPVDRHIRAMRDLGAQLAVEGGAVRAHLPARRGGRVLFERPTVGGTENALLLAAAQPAVSVIENAAREPEVAELCRFLGERGVEIAGTGTSTLEVRGVDRPLRAGTFEPGRDRIEAGTWMIAALTPGSDVLVEGAPIHQLGAVAGKLSEVGARVDADARGLRVRSEGRPGAIRVTAREYPAFPTDLVPPLCAALALADGTSVLTDEIYAERTTHVSELRRLGGDVLADAGRILVHGVERLSGARVTARDLRAGTALVIAGLGAEGVTEVEGVDHIDRGHEEFDTRLAALGAAIART
jgi:UDP-N-acetylglucosamine 1-carboxyvinyltransferase